MTQMIIVVIKRAALLICRRPLIFSLACAAGEGRGEGSRCILTSFLLIVVLASAGNPAAATAQLVPQVSVVFVEPEKFTDARRAELERTSTGILGELQKFIITTGARYVPENMKLNIRVTDIDLAGDFELFRGPQADQVRITKGLYPPRIALEFRVADAGGQTAKEGKRDLTDIDYQLRLAYPRNDYLRYEKELLRDWLRDEFGALKSARTN